MVPHKCQGKNASPDVFWAQNMDDADKNFGPNLRLLLKMHKIWSVDSKENY